MKKNLKCSTILVRQISLYRNPPLVILFKYLKIIAYLFGIKTALAKVIKIKRKSYGSDELFKCDRALP